MARYRCPGCERKTCCLDCVNKHKAQFACNGKRSRTCYRSVKDFEDQALISDLRFLEEVNRVKEANWRNLRRVALVFRPQEIPPHKRKLRYEARQRGIRLHFLPKGMSRNKSNSSSFDFRRNEILWDMDWTLEWGMPHQRIQRKRVPESETVSNALKAALASAKETIDISQLCVLMKRTGCTWNEPVYFDFDLDASLKSQLEGLELIEYPVLFVSKSENRSRYTLQERQEKIDQTQSRTCVTEDTGSTEC